MNSDDGFKFIFLSWESATTSQRGKKQEKLEDSLEESARHSGFGGPAATVAHSTLYLEEVDSASSMIQMDRDSPLMGFLIHENQET